MYTGMQQEVRALDTRMDKQEDEMAALRAQVAALQSRQEVAEKRFDLSAVAASGAPGTDAYERPADPKVLKINTPDKVTKDELLRAITPWIQRTCEDGQWELLAEQNIDKRFTIQFKGNPKSAADKAGRARWSLKSADGKWEQLSCTSTSGTNTQVYVAPDKNPRQVREETASKKLKQIICDKYARLRDKTAYVRAEECIMYDWQELCQVQAPKATEDVQLLWIHSLADKLRINKDEVRQSLLEKVRRRVRTSENWNARALLARSPSVALPKLRYLQKHIWNNDIIQIQELHGTLEDVRLAFTKYSGTFWVRHFKGVDKGTGGLLILMRKSLFPGHAPCHAHL
eukprot:376129-Karenia_brevis.AAC.1